MCTTRVGKIIETSKKSAQVEFFDGRTLDGIDISLLAAKPGSYVEVFGNLALSVLSEADARRRRSLWKAVTKAAGANI
jgi:hydrogenase maturation factor